MDVETPWQPIATAPKDGTPILAWRRKSYYPAHAVVVEWDVDYWHETASYGYDDADLSHWQPITPPPEKPNA